MHFVECECYGCFEYVIGHGIARKEVFLLNQEVKNRITSTTCFGKIIENVGVNRAPAWIRQSGQVGDSGRDTFENKDLIK